MSKRALLRLATCTCLVVSMMLLGGISALADEAKTTYEYNFDSDVRTLVIDTGGRNEKRDGHSGFKIQENFFPGYNGIGKSRYFNGENDYIYFNSFTMIELGAKSIRFKMKKEPSTNTNKLQAIISNMYNRNGIFIGIGGDSDAYPSAKPGSLYICSRLTSSKINYEIQTPESVVDGKWHDILFVWDGTVNNNAVKLYVDDMINPIAETTAKVNYDYSSPNSVSFGKAADPETKEHYAYNGYLDNIQFYDTVITSGTSTPDISNLKASAGNTKVDLSWNTVDKATSYTVKRATTAGGPYTAIATDLTDTSYTDTDVKNGTTYYYIVSAINAGAEIGNSNEASAQPTESQTPPTADSKLKVVLEVSEALRLSVDDDLNVNTQMTWSSSDPTVATVNEKGIVTALAPGNTVITVKSVDGSYTDYINVLVVENADDYRLAIDLRVGETARLTADDFTNTANVIWAPMDSSIANVTSKGKVTALSKGLVLISAKDADGNIIGRVYVRVRE